jgi:UV DNA damage endonuclease
MDTIKNSPIGIDQAIDILKRNLRDLLLILKWNKRHGIKLFRIGSDFAPHSTNPEFIPKADRDNYRALAYPIKSFASLLRKVGAYARKHNMRLTFHPDPFIVLGTPYPQVLIKSIRELYFHARVLDVMGLDLNSIIVLHGGGTYGDKAGAIRKWVKEFDKLPVMIKRRIAIENDEYSFNTSDMLQISKSVKPFPLRIDKKTWKQDKVYKIPVIFDIFHYECYNRVLVIRNRQQDDGGREFFPDQLTEQLLPDVLLPLVERSWGSRIMKMHISEQKRGGQLGAHSNYVNTIPQYILTWFGGPDTRTDLMVEAKMKEKAVARLRKKYPKQTA